MKTLSDRLDRHFLPAFRWLILAICMALAFHYAALWWHWEVRLPAWGLMPTRPETLNARLWLFWVVAAPAFGAAFFDLLKVPTKFRRQSLVLFSVAAVFTVAPYFIRHFFLS